jgi:hypothetical protein
MISGYVGKTNNARFFPTAKLFSIVDLSIYIRVLAVF